MKKQLTDEDIHERATIDGRVSFAVAAFALGAGLVALLDRIGVPEGIVGILGPVLVLAGLCLIGLLLHAVRVSRFYAAGRAVPPSYAGLALAALATSLALPFLPPVGGGTSMVSLLTGLAAGLVIAAFVSGPLIRKTGAFSLPDLIAGRFPHTGVRLGVVAISAVAALLIACAGFETSINALSYSLGAERIYAIVLIGFVLLLLAVPGGMGGVVWAATGAAGIFIAALTLPLASILLGGDALPVPVIGDAVAWQKATARIARWQFPAGWPAINLLQATAIAFGTACLAPLLSPAITTPGAGATRKAGMASLVWVFIILALVLVTIAVSAIVLDEYLVGERPDRLPAFAYAASGGGLLRICGGHVISPEQALAACRGVTGFAGLVLRPQDIAPEGVWLLHGLPELYGYGVAFSGLVGAGITAVALVMCAAGFQAFGTAIGHDGFYRVRDTQALTSRRLAITRVVMVLGIAVSGAVLARTSVNPRQMISLAIIISTAAIAPLVALALWPRASGSDAAIAMLTGTGSAVLLVILRGSSADIGQLAGTALIAAGIGLVSGFAVSFLRSGGLATEGSAFVHGILHGEVDVLNRDKGA